MFVLYALLGLLGGLFYARIPQRLTPVSGGTFANLAPVSNFDAAKSWKSRHSTLQMAPSDFELG
ncbi:MAG: hypothetical protein E5W98_21450 [Mesorhizobium sp.]|uniref:hypothetical protein n=1 Tax=Mesorhizobium sp. TaxID=1871066 RepID=UPI001219EEDC|nr:hypothetical protein [Mesorhizobium sp.]TIT04417.1 MAG: hypothetical protein E5W87_00100 [Mesorhizobium sp.]TKD40210.1 MAG: hypothetical protein E5W98_21450 [Mesorhizobium sp.]